MWCVWLPLLGLLGCSGAQPVDVCDARVDGHCRAPAVAADGLGLRVALSESAKSVCVFEEGCAGVPKGTIRIQPLEPKIREAVSEALVAAGLRLVGVEAERDMEADVEWRGTDTIALRLQDGRGHLIEQASYSRNLERCRGLAVLTWDTCWAANFERMKAELSQPLRRSAALLAFARRASGVASVAGDPAAPAPEPAWRQPSALGPVQPQRLESLQLQATVARYREQLERSCWQPAREAREPNASNSARVSTSITISPSGNVDNVTTAGDPPGYPHLARCIATQVRHWRFPPAKSPTTTSMPFVFASD
jgi:hypothetical protein